jgi:hypothetical protein
MKIRQRLLIFIAGVFTLLCFVQPAVAQPSLSAIVGEGENLSYFVLDFKNGPVPQSYAFGYRYSGAKTGGDMLDALVADVPTFTANTQTFGNFGRFMIGLGFDGKFQDNSPPNPNAFWAYWLAEDGLNWATSDFGLDGRPLANGSWDGWTWGQDFNNFPGPAPSTPFLSADAPEPGSGLLALIALGVVGLVTRRKQ